MIASMPIKSLPNNIRHPPVVASTPRRPFSLNGDVPDGQRRLTIYTGCAGRRKSGLEAAAPDLQLKRPRRSREPFGVRRTAESALNGTTRTVALLHAQTHHHRERHDAEGPPLRAKQAHWP